MTIYRRYALYLVSFILFATTLIKRSEGQIDVEEGRRLSNEIQICRLHLDLERRQYKKLWDTRYFESSIEMNFIDANLTTTKSFLDRGETSIKSFDFKTTAESLSVARSIMDGTDVALREDESATPNLLQRDIRDDYAVPSHALPHLSRLEMRGRLWNELSLTRRIVQKVYPEYGAVDNRFTKQCAATVDDFRRDFEPLDKSYSRIQIYLESLNYEDAHRLIFAMYDGAQSIAKSCKL